MAYRKVEVATVHIWGQEAGAITWDRSRNCGAFQYRDDFVASGVELSPVRMPLVSGRVYRFPEMSRKTFQGLPGLLADSLPDRFGNMLVDQWLAKQGRSREDFSPIERLCYMGSRGMGALEFRPSLLRKKRSASPIGISELVELANKIVQSRGQLSASLMEKRDEALEAILRVGTSAGGARAKAVIAYNPVTEEVRSGQLDIPPGFEAWLLKFDGVADEQLSAPQGYGRVEYAYYRMAKSAGITMEDCRLLADPEGRAHFMTRRFDRLPGNGRLHLQSLCGLAHLDFNEAGAHGYESAFALMRNLGLSYESFTQFFRRMVFNVLARNQDDHTRNISFLMDERGIWKLSPAYDVTWSYNPSGEWTARHQMRINGKTDGFLLTDLLTVAKGAGVKKARSIIEDVSDVVSDWMKFADEANVDEEVAAAIGRTHRADL